MGSNPFVGFRGASDLLVGQRGGRIATPLEQRKTDRNVRTFCNGCEIQGFTSGCFRIREAA